MFDGKPEKVKREIMHMHRALWSVDGGNGASESAKVRHDALQNICPTRDEVLLVPLTPRYRHSNAFECAVSTETMTLNP